MIEQQEKEQAVDYILSLETFAPILREVAIEPPIHLTRADVEGGFVVSTEVEEK